LGQGPTLSTINGGANGSVIFVADNSSLSLKNLTVANGLADTGAGIYNLGETAVDNTVFRDNNTTVGPGGGIASRGDLTVNNSTFVNNDAFSVSTGGKGGAIYVLGQITIRITNTLMTGNTAGLGGALAVEGAEYNNMISDVTVIGSQITNNQAFFGGGIRISSYTTVRLIDSIINDNVSTGSGGAIVNGGDLEIINSLLNGNSAGTNPGSFCGGAFVNTIVAGNKIGNDCYLNAVPTSLGHNLNGDNTCQFNQPTDLINTDPLLGPLQNNGGPTETTALLSGSPAIDSADNGLCPATDQRGVSRPWGSDCDIGAYEYNG
jgi:hypothetical protein